MYVPKRYNEFNRLSQFTAADGTITEYAYNGEGLRTSKTVGTNAPINYYWDRGFVSNEGTGTNITKTNYIGPGGIFGGENTSGAVYFLKDAHGDVSFVVDSTGQNKNQYDYDAWGNSTAESETSADWTTLRYAGEYFDEESGMIYLRNRYYDPSVGRFTQEDPIQDGLNWYVYANNNPIKYIDPSGLYYLEKDKDGQVYAVIESGDTLSNISYSEVADANAYLDLNYAEPGFLEVGQRVNITGIYNENYPVPTNIMLSKTGHTQGDSGLRDVPDEEISRRARDRNLSGGGKKTISA